MCATDGRTRGSISLKELLKNQILPELAAVPIVMSATLHRPLDYPPKTFRAEADAFAHGSRRLLWENRNADVVHTCRAPTFAPEHVPFRSEAILSSATKTDGNYAGLAKLGTTFRELKNNRSLENSLNQNAIVIFTVESL